MTGISGLENGIDRRLLAERVRHFRIQRGLTQEELAARAGVSLSTVYHVENGYATRRSTIRKVCVEGLGTIPEELVLTQAKRSLHPYLVYRHDQAVWHAEDDRREKLADDNAVRLQDLAERERLGRLGFVASFVNNPSIVMPDGPGTVFLEIHGRREGDVNAPVYRDAKLFCLRGAIRAQIRDEIVLLQCGDMIGYASADLRWIEPFAPLRRGEAPPWLLWMGAVRVGKAVKDEGRTIVRKPRNPR